MRSSKELTTLFFRDLKTFNKTNYKTMAYADLSKQDATVHKAFSSAITRYFIFREKHPEVTDVEHRMLYFKLKLDMVAAYFSEYPDTTTDNLVAFQLELQKYLKSIKDDSPDEGQNNDTDNTSVSDIQLVADNTMPIEQQQTSENIAI